MQLPDLLPELSLISDLTPHVTIYCILLNLTVLLLGAENNYYKMKAENLLIVVL